MDRLRQTIEKYENWKEIEIYITRIEGLTDEDFSTAFENTKAVLESIAKEICAANEVEIENNPSINKLLFTAFKSLGFRQNDAVIKIAKALSAIAHNIGDIRNDIGITSHGRPLKELDRRNDIDKHTREFLIDTVDIIASLLINSYENHRPIEEEIPESLYGNNVSFNDFWDDHYGDFEMGIYEYSASEILFHVDIDAYNKELDAFTESEI